MTTTFLVQPDGSVSASTEERETLVRASRYPEIEAMMEDPNASPAKALRSVYAEVITLLKRLEECGGDPFQIKKFKQYSLEIDSLFALASAYKKRVLTEKRDRLNFDAPQFQFAYNEIIKMMEEGVLEAIGKNSPALSQRIITNLRDRIKENEPKLRRGLKDMDSRTGTSASDASKSKKALMKLLRDER